MVGACRARCGNHRYQRGVAGSGETYQADIGQEIQLEAKVAFFAGESVLVFARSLMPGLRKMLIAASAAATVRDQDALAGRSEIGDSRAALVVEDQRSDRNAQNHVLAGMAGAVGAFAVAAAIGFGFAGVAVAQQGLVVDVGLQIHAAAVATVPSGGTAAWHVFFAPER